MAAILKSLAFLTRLTHPLSLVVLAFCSACYRFAGCRAALFAKKKKKKYDGYHSESVNGSGGSFYMYFHIMNGHLTDGTESLVLLFGLTSLGYSLFVFPRIRFF